MIKPSLYIAIKENQKNFKKDKMLRKTIYNDKIPSLIDIKVLNSYNLLFLNNRIINSKKLS